MKMSKDIKKTISPDLDDETKWQEYQPFSQHIQNQTFKFLNEMKNKFIQIKNDFIQQQENNKLEELRRKQEDDLKKESRMNMAAERKLQKKQKNKERKKEKKERELRQLEKTITKEQEEITLISPNTNNNKKKENIHNPYEKKVQKPKNNHQNKKKANNQVEITNEIKPLEKNFITYHNATIIQNNIFARYIKNNQNHDIITQYLNNSKNIFKLDIKTIELIGKVTPKDENISSIIKLDSNQMMAYFANKMNNIFIHDPNHFIETIKNNNIEKEITNTNIIFLINMSESTELEYKKFSNIDNYIQKNPKQKYSLNLVITDLYSLKMLDLFIKNINKENIQKPETIMLNLTLDSIDKTYFKNIIESGLINTLSFKECTIDDEISALISKNIENIKILKFKQCNIEKSELAEILSNKQQSNLELIEFNECFLDNNYSKLIYNFLKKKCTKSINLGQNLFDKENIELIEQVCKEQNISCLIKQDKDDLLSLDIKGKKLTQNIDNLDKDDLLEIISKKPKSITIDTLSFNNFLDTIELIKHANDNKVEIIFKEDFMDSLYNFLTNNFTTKLPILMQGCTKAYASLYFSIKKYYPDINVNLFRTNIMFSGKNGVNYISLNDFKQYYKNHFKILQNHVIEFDLNDFDLTSDDIKDIFNSLPKNIEVLFSFSTNKSYNNFEKYLNSEEKILKKKGISIQYSIYIKKNVGHNHNHDQQFQDLLKNEENEKSNYNFL
jgi:hypothetical protein